MLRNSIDSELPQGIFIGWHSYIISLLPSRIIIASLNDDAYGTTRQQLDMTESQSLNVSKRKRKVDMPSLIEILRHDRLYLHGKQNFTIRVSHHNHIEARSRNVALWQTRKGVDSSSPSSSIDNPKH